MGEGSDCTGHLKTEMCSLLMLSSFFLRIQKSKQLINGKYYLNIACSLAYLCCSVIIPGRIQVWGQGKILFWIFDRLGRGFEL